MSGWLARWLSRARSGGWCSNHSQRFMVGIFSCSLSGPCRNAHPIHGEDIQNTVVGNTTIPGGPYREMGL